MSSHNGTILIVDDVPTNLNVLMNFLQSSGFKVLVATDGEAALAQAQYAAPDMILLDVMMPGMDGFTTCEHLKTSDVTRDIPVIFMTALSDTVDKVRGFALGAVDYITKPLHQDEVVARVNAHLTIHRQKLEIARLREQDRVSYQSLSDLKDQMLNTASHDLKNPLAAIMASVGLLRHYVPPEDTRIARKLDDIDRSTLHMRDMIIKLLDLARLETGIGIHKEPASLSQIIETSLQHMRIIADQKHIRLTLHPPETDIVIDCDAFQIGQVLENLLSNAVKYTPEGGSIDIRIEVDETHAGCYVTDTGLGIPENDLPYIFDKFYRVNTGQHQAVAGTGLGLPIVREIVCQHGGNVMVESRPGTGSKFGFLLPRSGLTGKL